MARIKLSEHNIICDEIAFIQTKESINSQMSEAIFSIAKQKRIVIFTSAKAVAAVVNSLNGVVPDWEIYCISGTTKDLVVDYFGADKVKGFDEDAISLGEQILKLQAQDIVFFCGNKRLDTLPQVLSGKGFQVEEYCVYETILTPVKIEKLYNAILFFSPSGVESYLSENKIPEKAVLFSIGKTTAKALQQKVENEVIISVQPDKHILVETVIDFYKKQNK